MPAPTRDWSRFSNLKDLSLVYEGRSEVLAVRTLDLSPKGMFINTSAHFHEGAVLKVTFRLARSNHRVETRCEVRYCLPGVGIGVEFMGMPSQHEQAIRDEINLSNGARPRAVPRRAARARKVRPQRKKAR